ncbi:hypothetical protein CPLU01_12317 [Colletotrichum plurivorum]|uniref:Uncharacterized protein n=1 Tax=Colletotrichum plurivorum TaxID=2175906 RepID=A0A8H6K092_9PEZI|nr:hypothetical protein CPLU01_12317 [Colletotrichum plurivorum]
MHLLLTGNIPTTTVDVGVVDEIDRTPPFQCYCLLSTLTVRTACPFFWALKVNLKSSTGLPLSLHSTSPG